MNSKTANKRFLKASISTALVASSISAVVTPTAAATFNDLTSTNSHYENILTLLERGVIKGYPDGTYRPNVAVTRGQASKILAKTLNLNVANVVNPNFTDVQTTDEYYPYIAALVQAGILSGYSDQTFKPTQTITRGQMAKMIALGFQLTNENVAPFTDVPATHQYASYVNALFGAKVTTGKTDSTFDLNGFVTRGQLASFVVRAEQAAGIKETTVTGSISAIQGDLLTIKGKVFSVHKDLAFLLAAANKNALLNAEITFSAQNNEILSISSLSLKNGDSFDGQNATIKELTVPASITSLKNVVADTIQYAVTSQVNIENISAKKLTAQATPGVVASLANTAPVIDLVISGSNFELVQLIGAIASVQKTASTITNLQAEKVSNLQLIGDFKQVLLSALAKLTGTAIIEDIQFVGELTAAFQPEASVQINSIIVNGQRMSWHDMVSQLTTEQTNTNSNIGSSGSSSSPQPNDGGNTDFGDTDVPTQPAEPGDTEEPTQPTDPGDTEEPTQPTNPADTEEPTLPADPGDTEEPTQPTDPGDTEESTQPTNPADTEEPLPADPGDTEEPTQPTDPGDTEEPTQPTNPGDTEEPTLPADPGDKEEPALPTDSGDTEEPTQPTDPGDTEEPSQPGITEATVTGSISAIEGDTLTINGKVLSVHKDLAFLLVAANKNALLNADITFSVKNNEILAITSLSLKNGDSFDGQNATIQELAVATSITNLKNVAADTIHYAVISQVKIENVSAKKLTAQATPGAVASLANTAPVIDLVISGSNFDVVQLIGAIASVQKTTSTITDLQAEKVSSLQLMGDFKQVLISAFAILTGTAIIEDIQFVDELTLAFQPEVSVQINNIIVNGQKISWSDMVNQLISSQPGDSEKPTEPGDTEEPTTPAEPGDTEESTQPAEPGDTEEPIQPAEPGDTEEPIQPAEPGDTEEPTTPAEPGDTEEPIQPAEPGDTEEPTQPAEPGDTEEPIQPEQPDGTIDSEVPSIVAASDITVEGNTIQMTNSETNETVSYLVSNEIQAFFTNNTAMLSNVQIEVVNGEVTGITSAIVDADGYSFDGAGVAIGTLTINNASTITNVTSADNLIVSTNAQVLTFENVSAATITATGSFSEISGAAGENLFIASTAANVVVSNVTSINITIAENTNIAQRLAGKRIASVASRFAASETKMAITFADGNYKDKTLNVNRKDTVVNVSGNPFSEIQINSDNIDLYTFGQEINRLTVSNKVSYLALDANVAEFKVTLGQPLTIHSSSAKTIGSLVITAADTTNKIDLINVTVSAASFNSSPIVAPITGHAIFKQTSTAPVPEFSSALERTAFGKYKINIATAGTYYIVELKDSSLTDTFKTLNTFTKVKDAASNNGLAAPKSYTVGDSFVYYADVTDIVVYKVNGDTIDGVSVAAAPSNTAITRLYDISEKGALTYHTRFSSEQSPSSALGTVYVFKNGSLAKEVPVTGNWVDLNGLNTIVVNTGLTYTSTREVIVANDSLSAYGAAPATYQEDYVNILKVLAKKAVEKNNPKLIERTLNYVFSKQEGTYDSNFLSQFVNKVNANPANYNSIDSFKTLSDQIITANPHNSDVKLKASDLYLTGAITADFTYSTDGIITNTLSDTNEILFNAKATGSTTLRVTDTTGAATLVNVTVDANNKVTATVLAVENPTQGTFIEGAGSFRYSADKSKLIPTTLAKSAAIIKAADATIKRVTLTSAGDAFALSAEVTLTTNSVPSTKFGLNDITSISGDNVGFYKENDQFVLFARYPGTELALVTDGTNTTALNAETTTEIKNFEASIAKSATSLNITNNLNLLSVSKEDYAPANTKNIFLYNDGSAVTAFANDTFKGSIKLTDSANKISIINVNSVKAGSTVAVNEFEIVKASLAKDEQNNAINTGALVQNISDPVVRNNGLELYAIGTGTATVTLTNGKQYTVTVTISNGQYTIETEEVQNLSIKASDLHMTNISTVTGVGIDYQIVNTNSEVIISSPLTAGTVVTLTSTNGEKTLINVIRTVDGYTTPLNIYRSEVAPADVGLTNITNVYNAGTVPTLAAARAKVDANKLYVYNLNVDNQAFRVSDGTDSTVINVEVTQDGNEYKSTPKAVTHIISNSNYTIDPNKSIIGNGARLVGNTLYATGEGFNGSTTTTVQVPLDNGSYYVVNVNYNAATGLYNFDADGTVTFTVNFTKEQLGLETVTAATTLAANMTASVQSDVVTVAITKDTEGRIEVVGTNDQGQQAKSFIYIKRDAGNITKNIERAETAADTALDLDLTAYGYTTTPTGSWSVAGIARATISSALKLNFFAQNVGQSLFTLTDGNSKNLLVNVEVTGTDEKLRTTSTSVVEKPVSTDTTLTGTIISADGIRLSSDNKKVYATKVDGKATVKLSDGTYVAFTVSQNAGVYEVTETVLPNVAITLAGAKLLPAEPTNVVLQQGDEFVAIGEGTIHVLDGATIKQIVVTKQGEHFAIATPEIVSNAVVTATNLGLSTASALTIETTADPNFYVGQLDGKIVAYSKLTGATTGAYEFVVKAQETGDRAVVRLTDAGAVAITHTVAKADSITFNSASTVTLKQADIVRYDQANDTLYLLKEGSTYATADGRLFAVDVTRTNGALSLANNAVLPLQITDAAGTFTAITGTDLAIIELDGGTIHAKAIGTTKVKLGSTILTVTIAQNENGEYRMTKTETSSMQVKAIDAGLTNIKSAEVKAGVADAVSLSVDTDGLTIFSNGAKTAQSLLVHVEDDTGNKAAINVTVDATGAVTAAEVVMQTLENLAVTASETVQTAGARGVWNGTTLTVYSLAATDAALKFTNALVNVKATADGNKVNTPTITPLTHEITSIETSTTNAVKKDNPYLLETGSGLVYADNKVYSVDVKEENNQFVKTISTGVPAVTFDLTSLGGTYAENESTLTAAKVIEFPGTTNKLLVYANGIGTSELAITDGTNTTIYQTKATASSIDAPTVAKSVFTDTTMHNATLIAGDALRVTTDTMFFLKEGNVVLKANDKLINATVSRDVDGYFTATPAYVTKELKEVITLDSKFIANGDKNLFVKAAGEETFYTANYRVTATATEGNNAYSLAVDERHMVKFDVTNYFTGGTVTALASPSTHAFGEVVNNELIIYAGTTAGQSTVTFTNGTNNVTFNVTHDATGKVTATAQTAVSELLFADLELTDATIAANSFNSSIVELVKTDNGIKMYPKANGLTSFALTDGTDTVRLVNIKVETVGGAFKVTPTPVTFTAPGTPLVTTLTASATNTADKYYVTALGTALYGNTAANTATFISVTKNEDTGYYSVQTKEHSLATITATSLDISAFTNVSLVGSSVDIKVSDDKQTLYIYGTNNGFTDVLVDDGTNYRAIVATHQNNTVKATPAKKALTDLADQTWTSTVVDIRNQNIYATHAGKDVVTATITNGANSYQAFMNITVTRKANHEFDIVNNIARQDVGAATLISGTSIAVDGNYIYAQHVGSSVIQVGSEFKTVDVTQNADGFFTLTVGAGFTSNEILAAAVGLNKIDNYKLSAITGTDVVEVQIINGNAHLFAKKAGEMHLVLSEGTDPNKVQTSVHVLVEDQSGTLVLTATPSKLELGVKPEFKSTNDLFRLSADEQIIYAIKDGSIFATINSELHKLTVSDNKLYTTKTRIEAELPGVVTIPAGNTILTTDIANNKLVVAQNFGMTNITVDGAEYQVTVKQDGSIEYKELSTDVIDVSTIFTNPVTAVTIGSDSIVGTPAELNNAFIVATAVADNKITLTPVKEGTATVLISDGTSTIQAQVTVADNNGLQVTHVVPVSKYYTSTVGFYPTAITQPNGTPFTSANGLVTLKDGEITVYPGAVGTAQIIIEGEENRKGLFELTVTADEYKFGHFVQTIGYDKFASNPTVLATKGKAKATTGITGLDVIFEDLNEAFFVVKTTSGYKVVEVQAVVAGNSFSAKAPTLYEAHVVTGEVTDVKGLHIVEDGDNTIIYADASTVFPASYTLDGVIYEVTAGTAPAQLASAPLKAATTITEATHMQGDKVVGLNGTSLTANTVGKGIYKVKDGGVTKYIEVAVAPNGNSYTIDASKVLNSYEFNATLSDMKVLAPTANVYVDSTNNTIYGESTETIIVSAIDNQKKVVYSGTFASATFTVMKADVLAVLEWNAFASHSLNEASTIVRIEGNEVYALAPGEELITFKSPNGLERTLKVIVNADYTISISAETPHTLTYSAPNPNDNMDEIIFTFNLSIPENVADLTLNVVSTNNAEASQNNKNQLKVIVVPGNSAVATFEIVFPELVDKTPLPIKVVMTDIMNYEIVNEANAVLKFNLIQP